MKYGKEKQKSKGKTESLFWEEQVKGIFVRGASWPPSSPHPMDVLGCDITSLQDKEWPDKKRIT
jgi:hypothetical protein